MYFSFSVDVFTSAEVRDMYVLQLLQLWGFCDVLCLYAESNWTAVAAERRGERGYTFTGVNTDDTWEDGGSLKTI
jgi:hypothetical protein